MIRKLVLLLYCFILLSGFSEGKASWYGGGEKLNEYTASGRRFNPNEMGCASFRYPFGSRLLVTNLANDKAVMVTVYDRGPNKRLGREIDLYREAFRKIADLKQGLIQVSIKEV